MSPPTIHDSLGSLDGLTEPERRERLLGVFGVPGYAGTYVLGCFATRVTFFSQQVRALNLVDAICKSGLVLADQEVAVVGAGAAGLTAAAAFALRGVRVRLFEAMGNPHEAQGRIPIQRASRQRALHPHLYDWPWGDDALSPHAGLPVLDWKAGTANEVIASLGESFDAIRTGCLDASGTPLIRCQQQRLSDLAVRQSNQRPVTVELPGGTEHFRAVVLAVGFGIEKADGLAQHSYWVDDPADSFEARGRWLVSGFGDGALTDLLRLCIAPFDHQTVIEQFLEAVPPSVVDVVREFAHDAPDTDRSREFREAAAKIQVPLGLRNDVEVFLNCTEQRLFSGPASILNRLMVAWVLHSRSGLISFLETPGYLNPPRRIDDQFQVSYENNGEPVPEGPFDHVLYRHGPVSALQADFPEIWKATQSLRSSWRQTPASEDWTRRPLWTERDYSDPQPLLGDFAARAGCVIVTAHPKPDDLLIDVKHALRRARDKDDLRVSGKQVMTEATLIRVDEALSEPARYEHTLRALCTAQIAVFDLGQNQPGLALLLGVRAAVRRGVTIVVHRGDLTAEGWLELPFNLREISIVPRPKRGEEFIDVLRRRFVDASKLLAALPESYLDLPVFDAVRRLGADPDTYRPVPASQQALLLSWFDNDYLEDAGSVVESSLRTALGGDSKVLTMLNSPSPLLTAQKLYAEIRRSDLCVADWTGWRTNVLFEFGVRLASNPLGAIAVLCRTAELAVPEEGVQHRALCSLFAPFEYSVDDDGSDKLTAELKRRVAIVSKAPDATEVVLGARVTDSHTFRTVQGAIDHGQEPWAISVAERLTRSAELLLGKDMRQYPDSPVLFGEVGEELARRSGLEHLIAAWYYIAYRDGLLDRFERAEPGKEQNLDGLEQLVRVAREITATLSTLRWEKDQRYATLFDALRSFVRRARNYRSD